MTKEEMLEYKKKWYVLNAEKVKEYKKKWRDNNKEKIKQNATVNADSIKAYKKQWNMKNKQRIRNKNRIREQNRYKTDIQYKLAGNLRCRFRIALKQNTKVGSAVRDLGCSIEEFKNYIESKFKAGMTWDNHGDWHLDHILPLSSFDLTQPNQLRIALHYTNYQPLWALDNIAKNDKSFFTFKNGK